MQHSTTIQQLGEGTVQAVCSCGWHSPVFGADKRTGTMDPLQHATEAADLHEWEMSLRLARMSSPLAESRGCAWPVCPTAANRMWRFTVNGPDHGESPLRSQVLTLRGTFPREFTCDGANRRPRLKWSTPPPDTQELATELLDPTRRAAPPPTGWSTESLPASPAWRLCRPMRQKASTTSAGAATAARARRAAPRITTALCGGSSSRRTRSSCAAAARSTTGRGRSRWRSLRTLGTVLARAAALCRPPRRAR